MKTQWEQAMRWMLIIIMLAGINQAWAVDETARYITISGVVKDKQNKKRLEYVNISIPGCNVGTVTNADGEFSIKVEEKYQPKAIEVSHIGYINSQISINNGNRSELTVWLTPHINLLNEIVVQAENPRSIVTEALRKVPENYSRQNNMLTGFYREIAQKGRRYINISEAIIDVYKTPYNKTADYDRVQISKGRRLLSQKEGDTLAVKLLGGPMLSVYMDVVKNPDCLFDLESLNDYDFHMEESISIDNRSQWVISFRPRVELPYPLFYGTLYIDKMRRSFTRAEFSLSMDDRNKTTQAILKRKPFGLKFKPQEVSFVVTYKDKDGVTYLNYIRNGIRFKCDWKRKLFATNYNVLSEMVVTDRHEGNVTAIPSKMAFRQNQAFSDRVDDFTNDNFWGKYNIIEPTESLEHAVTKLKKQRK